jgi:predicted site-specific integrase-resolvase
MSDQAKKPERLWLKPAELAAREGVSRATVWRWIDKGLLEVARRAPATGVRVRDPKPS